MAVLSPETPNRMALAFTGSLLVNAALWGTLALGASRIPPTPPARSMEVRRVIIDNKGKPVEKKITPAEVKQHVIKVKQEPPPKPLTHKQPPPPPTAHNKVLVAPAKTGPATPPDPGFTARPDGNASVGKPTAAQGDGNAKVNPPVVEPPKVDPPKADPPKPDPPKVAPPVVDPPKPDPPKPDPPKPRGVTRDAEPADQVAPEIPESLKSQDFKSFVRVKVQIDDDGSFTVMLRTSSGNADVDKRVLDALKRWKWKPAMKDGAPVKSTQLFKFEIEIK